MAKINNIIKINGKSYDATTGAQLSSEDKLEKSTAVAKTTRAHVIAPKGHMHQTQHSKTLRRDLLNKPVISSKILSKPVSAALTVKLSASKIDSHRLSESKLTTKSKLVTRFASRPSESTFVASPAEQTIVSHVSNPKLHVSPKSDFLMQAIDNATSHTQPLHKVAKSKRHRTLGKIAGISSIAFGLSVLIGVIGFQSIDSLKLGSASNQAGFMASIPSNQPSGFSLGEINSSPGEITVNFLSNSNPSDKFKLIEKPSNWDNSTLITNYINTVSSNHQTIDVEGLTVFVLNNNSATWLSGGIWYLISGTDSLSTNQLIDLISSI